MRKETAEKLDFLKSFAGREVKIMEICGSHTAAVSKTGLRSLLPGNIRLISGPGCPVCVTPSAYIDRLIELACMEGQTVCVFGDLLRVPGSESSLSEAKGRGADVRMLYSPLNVISLAEKEPDRTFIFAAVGFETTTPAYALLLEELEEKGIENVKLLTALKTMPEAVAYLCEADVGIDGFFSPGHVCAVTGYEAYEKLAGKYGVNFAVAGFEAEELIDALYGLVRQISETAAGGESCRQGGEGRSEEKDRADISNCGSVVNYYKKAVRREGNMRAAEAVDKYFEKCDAYWRGIGRIENSGLCLRREYEKYDAGSHSLNEDKKINPACRCGEVLLGKCRPDECPLFGKVCTPGSPQGACMVSEEGACRAYLT